MEPRIEDILADQGALAAQAACEARISVMQGRLDGNGETSHQDCADLADLLRQCSSLALAWGSPNEAFRLADQSIQCATALEDTTGDLDASEPRLIGALRALSRAALASKDPGIALKSALRAEQMASQRFEEFDTAANAYDLALSRETLGEICLAGQRYDEAAHHLGMAVQMLMRIQNEEVDDLDTFSVSIMDLELATMTVSQKLADCEVQRGDLEAANQHLTLAHDLGQITRRRAPTSRQVLRTLANGLERIGDVAMQALQGERAAEAFMACINLRRALTEHRPRDSEVCRELSLALDRMGELYKLVGQTEKALACFQESHALRAALAEENPASLRASRELAWALYQLADLGAGVTWTDVLAQFATVEAQNGLMPEDHELLQRAQAREAAGTP